MSMFPHEPPAHSREEIVEFLDSSFPVQQYMLLNNPICTNCVICLEQFTVSSEVRTLSCNHTYHKPCLELLFQAKLKCGVCNRDYAGIGATGRSTMRLIAEGSLRQEDTSEAVIVTENEEQQIRV